LAGLSLLLWCLGPFAIVAGVLALQEIRAAKGALRGRGAATGAVVLGSFSTGLMLTVGVLMLLWGPDLRGWFQDDTPPGDSLGGSVTVQAPAGQDVVEMPEIQASIEVSGKLEGMPVVLVRGSFPDGSRLQVRLRCAGAQTAMLSGAIVEGGEARFGPLMHDNARLADGECGGEVLLDPRVQSAEVERRMGADGQHLQGAWVEVDGRTRMWRYPLNFRIGQRTQGVMDPLERRDLTQHFEAFFTLRDDLRRMEKRMRERGLHGSDEIWVESSSRWNGRRQDAIQAFQDAFGVSEEDYQGQRADVWASVRRLPEALYREWEAVDGVLSGDADSSTAGAARQRCDQAFALASEALEVE
jgi:PAS domain-containing protein